MNIKLLLALSAVAFMPLANAQNSGEKSFVVVVPTGSRYKAISDIANTKATNCGTSHGEGAGVAACERLFKTIGNTTGSAVPYKSDSSMMTDLLGGQVDFGVLPVHVAAGYINSGRVVGLAVSTIARHSAVRNVPTLQEVGYK